MHPKKSNLDPMAPVPVKYVITRGPRNRMVSSDPYTPPIVNYKYDIYTREGYFGLPTLDVNILIWTPQVSRS